MVYFIPKKGARLGNWLFQYAVAASLGDGRVATLDKSYSREAIRRYSDFLHGLRLVDKFPAGLEIFKENRKKYVAPPEISRGRSLVLDGYFQHVDYLDRAKFKGAFSLSQEKRADYYKRYGEWLNRPNVTSVHVRRGDYLRLSHCHPFVGADYFRNCLSRLPEVKDYLVFSDDIAWCKQFFPKAFPDLNFMFVEGNGLIDDFHLQSLCKNNVISNSSFSWWAAYLNDNPSKRVLAPTRWFGYYLKVQGIDGAGMYYDGVEKVPTKFSSGACVKAVFDMLRELPLNLAAKLYHMVVPR